MLISSPAYITVSHETNHRASKKEVCELSRKVPSGDSYPVKSSPSSTSYFSLLFI